MKENNGQVKSGKNNPNKKNFVFFNLKKSNNSQKLPIDEITKLYNMKRFISLQCVITKNNKYPNNEIIPSLPF